MALRWGFLIRHCCGAVGERRHFLGLCRARLALSGAPRGACPAKAEEMAALRKANIGRCWSVCVLRTVGGECHYP